MNSKQLFAAVMMAMAAGTSLAGTATELDALSQTETTLMRSEVIADFHLWQRAGMIQRDAVDYFSPDYQRTPAAYTRLRGGPAYRDEVARVAAERAERVVGETSADAAR